MKKLKMGLLISTAILAVIICWVFFSAMLYRQDLADRGPLTLEKVDQLATRMGIAKREDAKAPPGSELPEPVEAASADPRNPMPDKPAGEQGGAALASARKKRPALRRTLTDEERKKMAESIRELGNNAAIKLDFQFTLSLATAVKTMGMKEGAGFYYYDTAGIAYAMGDWDTAKLYYREALEYPLWRYHCQEACIRLANLEDDPNVVERLLDIACPEEGPPHCLYDAADLAYRTGSEEAYSYFSGRLREECPNLTIIWDYLGKPIDSIPGISREE